MSDNLVTVHNLEIESPETHCLIGVRVKTVDDKTVEDPDNPWLYYHWTLERVLKKNTVFTKDCWDNHMFSLELYKDLCVNTEFGVKYTKKDGLVPVVIPNVQGTGLVGTGLVDQVEVNKLINTEAQKWIVIANMFGHRSSVDSSKTHRLPLEQIVQALPFPSYPDECINSCNSPMEEVTDINHWTKNHKYSKKGFLDWKEYRSKFKSNGIIGE